ncbi:LysE family transporter [Niallia sp. Krafla_26]|uniref:LysE family transporter n=1 Tax=Niallia sp. Krafla_26 TaxID=3064703 RepID=UPI003D165C55
MTAATIGISAVIYHSALAFSLVTYAGAVYLLYLAYKSFTEKESSLNLVTKYSLNYRSLYKKEIIKNL